MYATTNERILEVTLPRTGVDRHLMECTPLPKELVATVLEYWPPHGQTRVLDLPLRVNGSGLVCTPSGHLFVAAAHFESLYVVDPRTDTVVVELTTRIPYANDIPDGFGFAYADTAKNGFPSGGGNALTIDDRFDSPARGVYVSSVYGRAIYRITLPDFFFRSRSTT